MASFVSYTFLSHRCSYYTIFTQSKFTDFSFHEFDHLYEKSKRSRVFGVSILHGTGYNGFGAPIPLYVFYSRADFKLLRGSGSCLVEGGWEEGGEPILFSLNLYCYIPLAWEGREV